MDTPVPTRLDKVEQTDPSRARLMALRDTLFFIFGGVALYNGLSAVPTSYFRAGVGAMLIVFGLWEVALRLRRRGL